MSVFPADKWTAIQLRFSIFPSEAITISPNDWWQTATGEAPAAVSENRALGSFDFFGPMPGMDTAALALHVEPLRVDWLTVPKTPDEGPSVGMLAFDFIAAISAAKSALDRWLLTAGAPFGGRLALGAHLLHPVPDLRAGYAELSTLVGRTLAIDAEAMREVMLQVNWPMKSAVMDVTVNRLSKWSVAVWRQLSLNGGPAQSPPVYMTRMEADFNTEQERDLRASPEQSIALFDEMSRALVDVASNGEPK